MSSTHTGNPASVITNPLEITIPADADALAAASVNTALTMLADAAALFQTHGAMTVTDTVPTAATDWQEFSKIKSNAGGVYFRTYRSDGVWILTYNAEWIPGTSKWSADAGGSASAAMGLSANGVGALYKVAGAADWSTWDDGSLSAGDITALTARSSATVGAGQSVAPGTTYKDGSCVAWAVVAIAGSTLTVTRSYNCASIVRSSGGLCVVTLQSAPANVFCAVATPNDDASTVPCICHARKTGAATIDVQIRNSTTGSAQDDVGFNIVVFGG